MPNTTSFDVADVVLVPFPFTDQSTTKKRPAVVVSSAAYHRQRPDIILMAITSQFRPANTVGEVAVRHWKSAGLIKPSVLKPLLATIEKRLVIRKMGALHADDQAALRKAVSRRDHRIAAMAAAIERHKDAASCVPTTRTNVSMGGAG